MTADSAARVDRLLADLEHFGLKLGLERMRRVLAELGSPERRLPVVLVAGTNGKGSTSAWIAAIATAAGYRSGLFTSPHLERVEERIRVDGEAIATDELESLLLEVVAASERAEGESVTYFEAMTGSALCHFARRKVDLAVLEVGLGGRLDATNVTSPRLSVITQIAHDHQRQLGETLPEIASEKAGILRPGRPALSSATDTGARAALARIAADVGAELTFSADLVDVERGEPSVDGGQQVVLRTRRRRYHLAPRLAGEHQAENLALAVCAAERIAAEGFPAIGAEAIERGVARCHWPGRLEWVELGRGRRVLLDAAHNPAGLAALGTYLRALDLPFGMVFGMLREKVDPAAVRDLWRSARSVVVTRPDSNRALAPEELVEQVGSIPDAIVARPGEAVERALAADELVVVCGSLYLVGELRTWLRRIYGVPPAADSLFSQEPIDPGVPRPGEQAGIAS